MIPFAEFGHLATGDRARRWLGRRKSLLGMALLVAIGTGQPVIAKQFGPFDYYDPPKGALSLVESEHFGPVARERARRGDWCWYWADLDYTLRAFPNHPGALEAMAEYLESRPACNKNQSMKQGASIYDLADEIDRGGWRERDAHYYFETAIQFRPNRAETHLLYGKYLRRKGDRSRALTHLKEAEKRDSRSAEVHFQLGLLYLETGDLEKARQHAETAYRNGHRSNELRERLATAGKRAP